MKRHVTVVVATFNRGPLLKDLIDDLGKQTYPSDAFEVIVVDDGSKEPVAAMLEGVKVPYAFRIETQDNRGAAAARDRGVQIATGDIIIVTDDDMRLEPDFIAQHVASHDGGASVVLGQICPSPSLQRMPLFERFHAYQLKLFAEGIRSGRTRVRGVHVCTGNLSFRRDDYLRLGGFDSSLSRSEDRELGVRLELAGAKLVFNEHAKTIHASDHADLEVWLRRCFLYGVYDHRISRKHPDVEIADPWRFFFRISPISRPLMLVPIVAPYIGDRLARLAIWGSHAADRLGIDKAAIYGTTVAYGFEYFRGMRTDAGTLTETARDLRGYLSKRRAQTQLQAITPSTPTHEPKPANARAQ